MASAQEIQDLVSSYLRGDIAAADLANGFAPLRKAALAGGEGAVRDLAVSIHVQLSYYFHSVISEASLREALARVNFVEVTISPDYEKVITVKDQEAYSADPIRWSYSAV